MHMNKIIVNVITIAVIASVLAFAGCVGKESTTPTATPSPTSTTPTATPAPKEKVNVTLKSGYKWYQDNNLSYRIGYPENWEVQDHGRVWTVPANNISRFEDWETTVTFISPSYTSEGMTEADISVHVSPNRTNLANNWSAYGGLDALKVKGIVAKYGNITINGREGFEVIFDPGRMYLGTPTGTVRYIIFDTDDLYYQIVARVNTVGDLYSKYNSTFDDVMNSFVIGKQVVSIPTITPTPTPTPTAIPTPKVTVSVTLKAGYKWYQDNDLSYRIGYPENWKTNSQGLGKVTANNVSGWENTQSFESPSLISVGSVRLPEVIIMVIVYQNRTLAVNWSDYGDLDKRVSKHGNITINGKEGFEVIYDLGRLYGGTTPTGNIRMIEFFTDDLCYVITAYANTPDGYNKYQSTFDDVINSFVIDK